MVGVTLLPLGAWGADTQAGTLGLWAGLALNSMPPCLLLREEFLLKGVNGEFGCGGDRGQWEQVSG